jgi:hypothetical protein
VLISLRKQGDLARNKEYNDYITERSGWADLQSAGKILTNGELREVKDVLDQLYGIIADAVSAVNNNLVVKAYEPYTSLFRPNTTRERWQKGDEQVKETLRHVHDVVSNRAQLSLGNKSGGIDLNFQPQFIDRTPRTATGSSQEIHGIHVPAGFKGFNFNIVRFTSGLTANGAFHLMFN